MKKINMDSDLIYLLYYDMKFSLREIARMFQCSRSPIVRMMKLNNLERRSSTEYSKISQNKQEVKEKKSESLKGKNHPLFQEREKIGSMFMYLAIENMMVMMD